MRIRLNADRHWCPAAGDLYEWMTIRFKHKSATPLLDDIKYPLQERYALGCPPPAEKHRLRLQLAWLDAWLYGTPLLRSLGHV